MLGWSVTVSGLWRGSFLVKKPHVRGGFSGGLFASNIIQVAVISCWNGSYGSMRPIGHVRHLAFGDRGHAKCAIGPKQVLVLEDDLFGLK